MEFKKNIGIIIILLLVFANLVLVFLIALPDSKTNVEISELNQVKNEIKSINQNEFIAKMQQADEDVIIIDVRTKAEFDDFHFDGALNIDYYKSNFRAELNKLDKNKTYLIYCRSGNRTGDTLRIMRELGFKNVYDLNGGVANCNVC